MAIDQGSTVLIVDDEEAVAEAYALWLSDEHDVRIAHGGREALERMDGEVDIVLLDRRMPGMSGDEVLAELDDRGYDCQIAMVTAVDPDFDIVEMDFDDYLAKPVTRADVEETVDVLSALSEYDEVMGEEFSLAKKQAVLESHKTEAELGDDEQYQELKERRAALRAEIEEALQGTDSETIDAAFEEVSGGESEA